MILKYYPVLHNSHNPTPRQKKHIVIIIIARNDMFRPTIFPPIPIRWLQNYQPFSSKNDFLCAKRLCWFHICSHPELNPSYMKKHRQEWRKKRRQLVADYCAAWRTSEWNFVPNEKLDAFSGRTKIEVLVFEVVLHKGFGSQNDAKCTME